MNGDFDQLIRLQKPTTVPETGFTFIIHPYKLRGATQQAERPFEAHLAVYPKAHSLDGFGWSFCDIQKK